MEQFDYIVVGGGSSGCVMASRLSEDPGVKVLLIESGRNDNNPWIHIPATFPSRWSTGHRRDGYVGEKSDRVNGRDSVVLQGHVIGGGSSVNAMLYVRGQAVDYDGWAQDGNRAGGYSDVLPAFPAISRTTWRSPMSSTAQGRSCACSETGFHHPG